MKKLTLILLASLWLGLGAVAWFSPAREVSDAERRKLAQLPELSWETVLDGSFMEDFENYTLAQFPLRDAFRQLKGVFHYKVLGQKDNNGIYIAEGQAAKVEYPLNGQSLQNAVEKLNEIYEAYLEDTGGRILFAAVPDKGRYLARANGYPAMDYEAISAQLQAGLPWAEFVETSDLLEAEDYYRTDTHWRQEKILDVAGRLCEALETAIPAEEDYVLEKVERPFYGVYWGQAGIPMGSEEMYLLRSEVLDGCTVYNYETGKTTAVYDPEKLESRDLYDVYLSGAAALLTIENPAGMAGKELIVFRDSFGSSLIPLLIGDYARVTVIDTRYIQPELLGKFVDFRGQDVLMIYSTILLNNSFSLK